ncbi:hypothetical protein BJX64DRAFT_286143 [Aspergillus heterothallicus]
MSYILIHRLYLKDTSQNNPTIYRLTIRSVSTAATSIVRLLRTHAKILPLWEISPFIVHVVLTAAMTHLCNATSTHQALRSRATAHFRVFPRANENAEAMGEREACGEAFTRTCAQMKRHGRLAIAAETETEKDTERELNRVIDSDEKPWQVP